VGNRALTRNAGDGLIETVGAAVEALGPTAECAIGECFVVAGFDGMLCSGVDDGERET
jgi:hypothetical protein